MTFFPPDPEMPEPEESAPVRSPWWAAPDDELPALLPVTALLAVTDHVAVALVGVAVYRDGVEFRLEGSLRRNGAGARDWADICTHFVGHYPMGGDVDVHARLRLGVELGDGERVFADRFAYMEEEPTVDSTRHRLTRMQGGAGGDSHSYTSTDRLWLWPLPPQGPLQLVMQWPALGIDERRITLDGTDMLAIAGNARPFWE